MADLSKTFDPNSVATAASKASSAMIAVSAASDVASSAMCKASDASSAIIARLRVVILKPYAEGSAISTGTGKIYFTVPNEMSGLDLKSCGAHLYTAGSGGTKVTLYNVTSAVDMLTSMIDIDTGESDSKDAASAAVINASADGIILGDVVRVDISTAASGACGLEIRAAFG